MDPNSAAVLQARLQEATLHSEEQRNLVETKRKEIDDLSVEIQGIIASIQALEQGLERAEVRYSRYLSVYFWRKNGGGLQLMLRVGRIQAEGRTACCCKGFWGHETSTGHL